MATVVGLSSALDVNNVQGDILEGLMKQTETYVFFRIKTGKSENFRKGLFHLVPHITTTGDVRSAADRVAKHRKKRDPDAPMLAKVFGINISFSKKGLDMLGITDEIGDGAFNEGMLKDAVNLGDKSPGNPDWIPEFKQEIHGLVVVAGDSHQTVSKHVKMVEGLFGVGSNSASMDVILSIVGDVRPGNERGHEHFGYLDGVSLPAVLGVDSGLRPGQELVRPGIMLCGREGDTVDPSIPNITSRPSWALDGSFLVFRLLPQLVPEFNQFCLDNALPVDGPNADPLLGKDLLGARLVGRWKSGAPVDLTPLHNDPALGDDPLRNLNFRYDKNSQERCPYAAHTRKMLPKSDLDTTEIHHIMRRGIPFGPEQTPEEVASGKTKLDRGLLFKCYQSSIVNGFQFLQTKWANNVNFPPQKDEVPGFDALIGQDPNSSIRTMTGSNPEDVTAQLKLPIQWVQSKGGEYFFAPSISTLRDIFALSA